MLRNLNNSPLVLVLASSTLVLLGILLADPFDITMNNMLLALICGLLLACFALFAGLFWNEKPADEREAVLIDKASRLGYLAGMAVLVCGVVVQSFDHDVDPWLISGLITMVFAKLVYITIKK